ncbi:MAG: hypothetical protein K6G88_10935 [Lachnospiraceae bacterium]|nr:hypothetical protein [Lachnospiraceae bacterium]
MCIYIIDKETRETYSCIDEEKAINTVRILADSKEEAQEQLEIIGDFDRLFEKAFEFRI